MEGDSPTLSQASIKNVSISEVEFGNTTSVVQGNDVTKISTFHSFQFIEKGFRVWHYYGIGAGVFHPFSSEWFFISSIKEKQPFIEFLQRLKPIPKKVNNKEVKPRKHRQLCRDFLY